MKSIVTVTESGIIKQMFEFDEVEKAESAFVDLVIYQEDEQPASDELNGALDDGYWEVGDVVIHIGQAEVAETSDTLKVIRESNNQLDERIKW